MGRAEVQRTVDLKILELHLGLVTPHFPCKVSCKPIRYMVAVEPKQP